MFTTKLVFTTCVSRVVDLLCRVWLPSKVTKPKPRTFIASQTSDAFVAHFDKVQEQLETISSLDELVTGETNQALSHRHISHDMHPAGASESCLNSYIHIGMLSKSKGQILRVAAAFHVLFAMGTEEELPENISEEAIIAAIDFVGLCLQQTAFMAGRGEIAEDIQILESSMFTAVDLKFN